MSGKLVQALQVFSHLVPRLVKVKAVLDRSKVSTSTLEIYVRYTVHVLPDIANRQRIAELTNSLDSTKFEWVGDRNVRVMIGPNTLFFST
jgi:hypothetical protein